MADPDPAAEDQRGFLRTNAGIVYLAVVVAIPFVIASLLIGLNIVFTVALLVLFVGVAFAVPKWIVSEHVDDGRQAINFSDINQGGEGRDEVVNVVKEGSMPPSYFTRFGLNKQAKLSKAEIGNLVAGLEKMPEFRKRGSAGG